MKEIRNERTIKMKEKDDEGMKKRRLEGIKRIRNGRTKKGKVNKDESEWRNERENVAKRKGKNESNERKRGEKAYVSGSVCT